MKNHQLPIILFFLVLIVFPSCVDDITFESPDTIDKGIAIQGVLKKGDPNTAKVTIRNIFNFVERARPIVVRSVTLLDETGMSLELPSRQDGIYETEIPNDAAFLVDFNKSYKIRIETFDNRTIESEMESILPVTTPTDLKATRVTRQTINPVGGFNQRDFISFSIDTPLRLNEEDENIRLLWELGITYKFSDTPEELTNFSCFPVARGPENKTCFVDTSPADNTYITLNGKAANRSSLDDFILFESTLNQLFAEGYYLSVLQQSMTSSAFDYWSQLEQITSNETDVLFAPPVGRIKTNLFNVNDPNDKNIFGYFYATEEKPIRVFVSPEMADNPALPCPGGFSMDGRVLNISCCDCLQAANSFLEQPDWWIE